MSHLFMAVTQNENKSQPSQWRNVGFICSLCACVRAWAHVHTQAPALPPAVLWIASLSSPWLEWTSPYGAIPPKCWVLNVISIYLSACLSCLSICLIRCKSNWLCSKQSALFPLHFPAMWPPGMYCRRSMRQLWEWLMCVCSHLQAHYCKKNDFPWLFSPTLLSSAYSVWFSFGHPMSNANTICF